MRNRWNWRILLIAAVAANGAASAVAVTTSVGGGTFDVGSLLGADRYYDHTTSITGQSTISTNLEAGFFWNGHETLQHVATTTTNFVADTTFSWGGASIPAKYDRHATWAAMLIGGRATAGGDAVLQQGIAYGTDLRSGAIASSRKWGCVRLEFRNLVQLNLHALRADVWHCGCRELKLWLRGCLWDRFLHGDHGRILFSKPHHNLRCKCRE